MVAAQQDHAWQRIAAGRQQLTEVSVSRDDHLAMCVCVSHHVRIWMPKQADLADMNGLMASLIQQVGNSRSQALVDEELHAEARNGNSRSRIASAAN